MIIGNFNDDAHSDTLFVNSTASKREDWNESYYYIDDVIVTTDSNYADSLYPTSVQSTGKPVLQVEVYPNPGNGIFNFQSETGTPVAIIEIYNMLGQVVYSNNINNRYSFRTDVSSQPPGIYLYRLLAKQGELIQSGKLIIQ